MTFGSFSFWRQNFSHANLHSFNKILKYLFYLLPNLLNFRIKKNTKIFDLIVKDDKKINVFDLIDEKIFHLHLKMIKSQNYWT